MDGWTGGRVDRWTGGPRAKRVDETPLTSPVPVLRTPPPHSVLLVLSHCQSISSPFRFLNGDICHGFPCARSVPRLEAARAAITPVGSQRSIGSLPGVRPVSGTRPDSLGRSDIPPHHVENIARPRVSAGVDVGDHPESTDHPLPRRRSQATRAATLTSPCERPSRRVRRVAGRRHRDGS